MILWLFHQNISITYGRLKIFIYVKLWAKWIKELIMKRKLKTLCLRRRREKVTYESFNLLTSLSKIWICSLIKPRYATRSGKYERGTTTSPKLLSNYVEFMHTITSQKYLGHIWCKEIKSENGPGGHHARPRATLAWLAGTKQGPVPPWLGSRAGTLQGLVPPWLGSWAGLIHFFISSYIWII